jgi:hypothetical protein
VNWYYRKNFQIINSAGLTDHLALEKGFERWHMTILEDEITKDVRLPSSKQNVLTKTRSFGLV